MTYLISQPYYLNKEETVIRCIWDHPEFGPIPFSATPNDDTTYGPEIFFAAKNGEYGPLVSYENSHWYSLIDDNEWQGKTYRFGELMLSLTGEQPPNSTNKPKPVPPLNNASTN